MGEIIKNGIKDVIITPLNIINTNGGSVYHALKKQIMDFYHLERLISLQ